MFRNYFKIAWRNLFRNKVFSFINILGLAIGLASAMLIILYVKDEKGFDHFNKNGDHIYRVAMKAKMGGVENEMGISGYLQGPRFTKNVPGIKSFVRISDGTEDIKVGNDIHSQELLYVDSNFFSMFTFPLIEGDSKTCLTQPQSIVLSEKAARRQFGSSNAVGKEVMIRKDSLLVPYRVTAVAKDCPQNSTIQFDVLLPLEVSPEDAQNNDNWYNFSLNTFLLLNPNARPAAVEGGIQAFYLQDAAQTFKKFQAQFGDIGDMGTYFLQPYFDIHTSTSLPPANGLVHESKPMYSYILAGIALFILLIACINFINLTVARSVKRAKEIGIRKVIGGKRGQLIRQFLGESLVLCLAAFILAIGMVILVLPMFNQLSGKGLSFSYLMDTRLIIGYALLFMLTALLAGLYPAFVLSGYKPVKILYNRFTLSGKNYLQKGLVILQFSIASFLIVATLVIYSQFNFLATENLGYDDSNLLVVNKDHLTRREAEIFKSELAANSQISGVAIKNGGHWETRAKVNGDSAIQFTYETVDESYIPLLKIPILAGRTFSVNFPSDSANSVIVNESFVQKAGWKNPIGQTVNFWYNNNKKYTVIGVVKDYHYESMLKKTGPQLFTMKPDNPLGTFYIKIKPGSVASTLGFIETNYKKLFPISPYSYTFKSEDNLKSYESEARWRQIIFFSALITIFVSCIGLFGLSVLSAEKRTKEIGIRKVLGASVKSIASTLSFDFLKLVTISLLIAVPAVWMASHKWLENYPYRITLGWWIFLSGCLIVVFIALLTVGFQAIRAATANPVKSLRSE